MTSSTDSARFRSSGFHADMGNIDDVITTHLPSRYSLKMPKGANGTLAQPGPTGSPVPNPTQVAPFPAYEIGGAFATAGILCYGGDKSHLFSVFADDGGLAGPERPGSLAHFGFPKLVDTAGINQRTPRNARR